MFRPPRSARNTLTIVASVRPIELSIDGRVLIDELSAIESGGASENVFDWSRGTDRAITCMTDR
jgi:hypothetical protein